ncbi:asparagine synthase (glutamine-hydrolyzing) [Streptomyces osmaniensis]|uniref:asparagine synthase (glutamine-hydrolyzing) n=1 Tax=Streptomyces osmaniensis TaxID=593134 RepID=A0ABP6XQ33_9ACTN|nr:asparagine synthase (glutamine-hydrolyzing) [Streptomyces sp. JCM17656]
MCGLAGLARIDGGPLSPSADQLLAHMSETIAHRGPDADEILRDGPVGMAFRRLSLIDVAGGGQPLISDDGRLVLIANGEVYNHKELADSLGDRARLRTGSDCEVLLYLYRERGMRFLDDVRGMFGLILWDRAAGKLVLARDRFGVKPVYYHRNHERLVFASEIKALFCDPATARALDWDAALADQALNGAPRFETDAPGTWFEGVEQVPAATIVEVDLSDGAERRHQYWSMPVADETSSLSDGEYVAAYRELLESSVAECATADVGVGLFLSGGIDSATVAALAARTTELHTFTVVNGSTFANGDAEAAHYVARRLELPHTQVLFPADSVPTPDEWRHLVWLTEMPQCGPEQFYKYQLHRHVTERFPHIKAMLLGAASDEFNGGYSEGLSFDGTWAGFERALGSLSVGSRLQHAPRLASWWDWEHPLLADGALEGAVRGPRRDPYQEYIAWKYRGVQRYNVWHEDRTAAGNGIEARVPFLDHRLVELSVSVPADRRARLLWDKRILRDGVRDLLPHRISDRTKIGFYEGSEAHHTHRIFIEMLAQQGAQLLDEALAAPRAREYLDPDGLRAALAELVQDPRNGHVEAVLGLVNLGLLDRMTETLPPPPSAVPTRSLQEVVSDSAWERVEPRARALVLQHPRLSGDERVILADQVTLAADVQNPKVLYVAVRGALTYVVEHTDNPAWWRVLQAIDGHRRLDELLAAADCRLEDVLVPLREAVDVRVVCLEPATAASGA